ncbi:hypothetical protein [Klebsiella pneumoniae]|nr:hypothetical protein [Klebsiella pneumoniae]MDX6789076.1 hypothetical protein [Klebsiella pneumoniae]
MSQNWMRITARTSTRRKLKVMSRVDERIVQFFAQRNDALVALACEPS